MRVCGVCICVKKKKHFVLILNGFIRDIKYAPNDIPTGWLIDYRPAYIVFSIFDGSTAIFRCHLFHGGSPHSINIFYIPVRRYDSVTVRVREL